MQLLVYLAEQAGNVVTRDQILEAVWEETFVTDEVLTSAIRKLRKAFGDEGVDPQFIQTIPKKGYCLIAPVSFAERDRERSKPHKWVVVLVALLVAATLYFFWDQLGTDRSRPPSVLRLSNPVQVTSAGGVEDYPAWSPDGRTLAYAATPSARPSGGNWDIWVVRVSSGQPVNRTADHTGVDRFPVWSPDGAQIAFWSSREGGGYFLMSALGGAPRKLLSSGRLVEGARPQWSGDGKRLAGIVTDTDGNFVEIVPLETRESQRLRLPGKYESRYDLAWSPDGRYFAYVDAGGYLSDRHPLLILRIEDREVFPVTAGQSRVWSPGWSVDGRSLYFVTNRGGSMDLWRQSIGEGGVPDGQPEPWTAGMVIRSAGLSPDGSRLAYSKGRPVSNVWRVPIPEERPATWEDAERLTFDQAFIANLDVSPDGGRLVLDSDRSGTWDLWVLSVDGGKMTPLTMDPGTELSSKWSPNGQSVAFHSARAGSPNRDIRVIPVGGGPTREVAPHPAQEVHPAWSPDGRDLAFVSFRSGSPDIWKVSLEGGEPQQLTQHAANDNQPAWSPDGKVLAFVSYRDGARRLWQIPAAGGQAEPLTEGPAGYPIWSRDGRRVYFPGVGERAGNLWMVSVEDGTERPMTDFQGKPGTVLSYCPATDGRYLYFAWEESLGDIWVIDVAERAAVR
jgi:Tol biopolymer transport system component